MTKKEAIEELENIIGTRAPVAQAESLKHQIALGGGDEDAEIAPEYENAVKDIKKRAEGSTEEKTKKV